MINIDCVRDLLLTIDRTQQHKPNGHARPWKLRRNLDTPPLSEYPQQVVFDAAKYLLEEGLIKINALTPDSAKSMAPRCYVVHEITSTGYDFLAAIQKPDLWTRLKARGSDIAKISIKAIIEEATKRIISP